MKFGVIVRYGGWVELGLELGSGLKLGLGSRIQFLFINSA